MPRRPDAALEVALEQRRRLLRERQHALAEADRALGHERAALAADQERVATLLDQIASAQHPRGDRGLDVSLLGHLERVLLRCEAQVDAQAARVEAAQAATDEARAALVGAHQQVRVLELVLESRAAERAEARRRAELRLADETAARSHARGRADTRLQTPERGRP